jgi:uncharacterized protein (DUF58 family)
MKKLDIEVYPLIRQLKIATRKFVTSGFTGEYTSFFRGRGLDFSDFREYTMQDDASLIDWKASLRANQLLVKEYEEERNIKINFLFDVSNSMIFGSSKKLKNEYAASLIASLSYHILDVGDAVGLVMFNNEIVKEIPPKQGMGQFYVILKHLSNADLYGGNFDLGKALSHVLSRGEHGGILIIVSDFLGLKEDWEKILRIASKKFDIIGMMVRDIRDEKLETEVGQVVVSDPYSNANILIDPKKIKNLYEERTKAQKEAVRKILSRSYVDLVQLYTHESFISPLISFFGGRERRLLR